MQKYIIKEVIKIIIDEFIEVKITASNFKHYKNLGYSPVMRGYIVVMIKDLSDGCNIVVNYKCDYCGKIYQKKYSLIKKGRKIIDKDCCNSNTCLQLKSKECLIFKYGVNNPIQIEGIAKLVSEKIKEKRKFNPKFGLPEISPLKNRESVKKGMLKKYGVEHPSKSLELQKKKENTCLERYGVKNIKQFDEFKQKALNTAYNNGSFISSKAQRYVCELLSLKLNYPLKNFAIDIADDINKIAIEWDGSGHDLSVRMGSKSEFEFIRNGNFRKSVLYNDGWKIFTIISTKDNIPNDELLLKLFEKVSYYFNNNYRHWFEYYVEENIIKCSVCDYDLDYFLNAERLNELTV